MTRLTLERVACARGGRMLFEGLTVDLGDGGAATVTGANGAGKSSLLRLATGLLAPAAGAVTRDGDTALLVEDASLDPELPLAAALRWWARIDGRAGAVASALDDVALGALADVPVRLLSTGQRKRALLARTIASRAAIWLLDEPANGLDAASVATLERLIARHRAGGDVALVATHLPLDLPDAARLAL